MEFLEVGTFPLLVFAGGRFVVDGRFVVGWLAGHTPILAMSHAVTHVIFADRTVE